MVGRQRREGAGRRPLRFASLDDVARRRTRRLASLALAIAELGGLAALLLAPAFTVHSVGVSGTSRLTTEQVLAIARIGNGPVFLVDPAAVRRRLEASAWVRAASVNPQLLDRVTIQIEEWQPVALYRAGTGTPYLLSDQAAALGVARSEDLKALPEIDGPAQPQPVPGRAALDPSLLTALVNIQRGLPTLLGEEVQSFTIDACGNLTLNSSRGWNAQFGRMLTPEELASLKEKVGALKALAAAGVVDFNSSDLQYVNVMNPTLPAVKTRDRPVRPARAATPSPAPSTSPTALQPATDACR
jgi:cell division septal protein FtsQ